VAVVEKYSCSRRVQWIKRKLFPLCNYAYLKQTKMLFLFFFPSKKLENKRADRGREGQYQW
jgi:hypothetical protein